VARNFLKLRKLTAGILAFNAASRQALSNAGFETVGIRRRQFLVGNEPVDEVLTEKIF